MFIQQVPPVKGSATKFTIILEAPGKMFILDVVLSMRFLGKVGATHCALEPHLSTLRLKFLNVIEKNLSGVPCNFIRNCRVQKNHAHIYFHLMPYFYVRDS